MRTDDGIRPYTQEEIEFKRRRMVDAQADYRCALLRNRIMAKNSVPALELPTPLQLAVRTVRAFFVGLKKEPAQ